MGLDRSSGTGCECGAIRASKASCLESVMHVRHHRSVHLSTTTSEHQERHFGRNHLLRLAARFCFGMLALMSTHAETHGIDQNRGARVQFSKQTLANPIDRRGQLLDPSRGPGSYDAELQNAPLAARSPSHAQYKAFRIHESFTKTKRAS